MSFFTRKPKNPFKVLRNQRGVALLIALFALTLMMFVATEVSYDTSLEYVVARQQVNQLKAYYAARSGVEISLLRILLFKKALAAVGKQLGPNQSMLDPIWSMPFMWPPVFPEEITGVDKENIESLVKNSPMDAQYTTKIESEGGKIDINDLGSESKALREATRAQILKVFQSEIERSESFSKKYRFFKFDELINNLVDWVDADSDSLNGGGERDQYRGEMSNEMIPPNQPFKTMEELNMVAMMEEPLFNILKNRVTLFGTKGINVNFAPKEVLAALDPSLNDDALSQIIKRRDNPKEGGPFQNEDDFYGFIQRFGANVQAMRKSGVPLVFGRELNFRITSVGIFGNTKREITAITFDIENIRDRYLKMLDDEAQGAKPGRGGQGGTDGNQSGGGQPPAPDANQAEFKPPKGRPTVVFWQEN